MKVNIEKQPSFNPVTIRIDIEDQYDIDCIIWCLERGLKEIIKTPMDAQIIKKRITGLIESLKPLGS